VTQSIQVGEHQRSLLPPGEQPWPHLERRKLGDVLKDQEMWLTASLQVPYRRSSRWTGAAELNPNTMVTMASRGSRWSLNGSVFVELSICRVGGA
jgi:hypothetical protein